MATRLTGDWGRARRALANGGGGGRLGRAITRAVAVEAQALRKEIVQGLTKQRPGGTAIRPLARLSLASRRLEGSRKTKALIDSADLRNSVTVVAKGDVAFVGVPRKAKRRRADRESADLVKVAEIHEYGTRPTVIPITPNMRRFLAVLFKEAGVTRPSRQGGSTGVVVTQIPARPFLRPAFEVWKRGVDRRIADRIAREMGWRG